MDHLREAPTTGSARAIDAAIESLDHVLYTSEMRDWRLRIHELAAALFQSISMQLSVDKYAAIAVDRGASLDTLDFPLNNRRWLEDRFGKIQKLTAEAERLKAIDEIVRWTDPGPGGFYDDLGNAAKQPHLVQGRSFADDPGRMRSARVGFEEDLVLDSPEDGAGVPRRVSWIDHAETLYDTPLRMTYPGLDPKARILAAGRIRRRQPETEIAAGGQRHDRNPSVPVQAVSSCPDRVRPPGRRHRGRRHSAWPGPATPATAATAAAVRSRKCG